MSIKDVAKRMNDFSATIDGLDEVKPRDIDYFVKIEKVVFTKYEGNDLYAVKASDGVKEFYFYAPSSLSRIIQEHLTELGNDFDKLNEEFQTERTDVCFEVKSISNGRTYIVTKFR